MELKFAGTFTKLLVTLYFIFNAAQAYSPLKANLKMTHLIEATNNAPTNGTLEEILPLEGVDVESHKL